MSAAEIPSLDDRASECVDRTTNPRGWVIARNYIQRCDRLETRLAATEEALREIQHTRQSDNPASVLWRECLRIADAALAGEPQR